MAKPVAALPRSRQRNPKKKSETSMAVKLLEKAKTAKAHTSANLVELISVKPPNANRVEISEEDTQDSIATFSHKALARNEDSSLSPFTSPKKRVHPLLSTKWQRSMAEEPNWTRASTHFGGAPCTAVSQHDCCVVVLNRLDAMEKSWSGIVSTKIDALEKLILSRLDNFGSTSNSHVSAGEISRSKLKALFKLFFYPS